MCQICKWNSTILRATQLIHGESHYEKSIISPYVQFVSFDCLIVC